jgi:Fur family zinc uptake transcriptional regulator
MAETLLLLRYNVVSYDPDLPVAPGSRADQMQVNGMAKGKPKHRRPHDHDRCVQRAVAAAERLCEAKQIQFTPLRKRILTLVWRQHEPIGAYEILAELAKEREKAAPPTVYRALEFLQDAGLVHRLDSLNAFLGCEHPESPHAGQFLVCGSCRRVAEIEDDVISRTLRERAQALGFQLKESAVEIKAVCTECAKSA